MSILRAGDEKFHYSDGSHKWIPPDPDYDQDVWNEQICSTNMVTCETSVRRSASSG
ncbi:hypothetical protein MED01_004044 [Micromonospora sp. MED01]|uniref:hypothetical protein n=1 Tax=Micromonospora alfalfae TaxID=2911212 RepID=UPI001EE7B5A9|nr:hypothetical protein [Micromonospora alfalfae]MCG5460618.1 hypothetical protein [Micromonospora alfalfae]